MTAGAHPPPPRSSDDIHVLASEGLGEGVDAAARRLEDTLRLAFAVADRGDATIEQPVVVGLSSEPHDEGPGATRELDGQGADAAGGPGDHHRLAGLGRHRAHAGESRGGGDEQRTRVLPAERVGLGGQRSSGTETNSACAARSSVQPSTASPAAKRASPSATVTISPARSVPSPDGNVAG